MVIAALCAFAIIPLPAVLQKGSIMREPVGAAPYAMFLAALPLAWLWRRGMRSEGAARGCQWVRRALRWRRSARSRCTTISGRCRARS